MIVIDSIEYKDRDVLLEGYLAYDSEHSEKRPGILVVHDWYGMGPYVRSRAEQLAALGYVAFAADIYGKGVKVESAEQAASLANQYKSDRALFRARARAGLGALEASPLTDGKRIAAIGYCFGGTGILELARSGVNIAGFVSFHGGLATPTPDDAINIKGKVMVLHGADDPIVSEREVLAFQQEMRAARVDWQMISYGGAVHSFTVPHAGNDPSTGAAYNERADRRSWEAMRTFFNEIFGQR